MNLDFWKHKRVLVTGHTGFKGAWLSQWLIELGADVCGFALKPPTQPSLFDMLELRTKMDSYEGDIRDAQAISEFVAKCQPDIVIHMAAQSLVLRSYDDPVESYMVNVIGTTHVFEAIRASNSVKAVVNITTDKCYENKEWLWAYRENEAFGGHDPYSSSKACAELVTTTYRNCFFSQQGVRLASARAGNVIGGGDWADNRLIPDFIRSAKSSEPVVIRSPNAIRPWQHVLEPLGGYLMLAEKLYGDHGDEYAEGWNFGPYDNDAKPVNWILDTLCEKWGEDATWRLDDADKIHPHEANYLKLDCSKARARLGWEPCLGLNTALDWIVDWHRSDTSKASIIEKTKEQIRHYQECMCHAI